MLLNGGKKLFPFPFRKVIQTFEFYSVAIFPSFTLLRATVASVSFFFPSSLIEIDIARIGEMNMILYKRNESIHKETSFSSIRQRINCCLLMGEAHGGRDGNRQFSRNVFESIHFIVNWHFFN